MLGVSILLLEIQVLNPPGKLTRRWHHNHQACVRSGEKRRKPTTSCPVRACSVACWRGGGGRSLPATALRGKERLCGALVPVKNVLKRDRGQDDEAVASERKVFPMLLLLHSVQISLFNMAMTKRD